MSRSRQKRGGPSSPFDKYHNPDLFSPWCVNFVFFFQEHLMDFIVRQKGFWLEDDESVLKAIHEGFIQTHYAMWKELGKTF